ncbi:predicted protein [Histoplasma mississippiense (nom. inval.)]|uniref:predicted protein n=1 Tax=Ajellomyces capsulatus (strain NAm1 / WU24) TaxID=2059318 RepID=UPI000157C829|nr:predicted protein [Histoplasma mississippiense (nom. inval.)]EDN09824.1 predicted protein [Histoplasma mississippiense (nom. inval.)]
MTGKQNNQDPESVFVILNISESNVIISTQVRDLKDGRRMSNDEIQQQELWDMKLGDLPRWQNIQIAKD